MFPKPLDNSFQGNVIAKWSFFLVTIMIIGRSLIHMFAPAAGPLSLEDSDQRLGFGQSWDVSLGDFDGDDDLDAFVATAVEAELGSAVWLNEGGGIFTLTEQELGYGNCMELGDL